MDFSESVKYLYGLGNEVLAMKLGLENIGALLVELGSPQKRFHKVQIAGTNGKGSTCAFLEAICLAAGVRTGTTTSPHLISVTERIRIDGRDVSEDQFAWLATRVRAASEKLVSASRLETVPTYFEQVTAIALLAFAEAGVDLAILETGLGGRFDATSAARAEIVGISRIDLDHQRILGETIAEIAAEKAAIIRPDTLAVVGEQTVEASTVIDDRLSQSGVSARYASDVSAGSRNGRFVFKTPTGDYSIRSLGIRGAHQTENAKIAILLAELLRDRFDIDSSAIEKGLESAVHRGRLEHRGRFLFDGAHNENGARALREYLESNVTAPIVMVFGSMREKNLAGIAVVLFPLASKLILTRPDNPRSAEPAEIETLAREHCAEVHLSENVAEAAKIAKRVADPNDTIVVTGSLYLVGEALALFESGEKF